MDTQCTKPEETSRVAPRQEASRRVPFGSLAIFAAFALSAFTLSGCSLIFPPASGCPQTEELCPDLTCDYGFAIRDDGCAMCECAGPPTGDVCWDTSECAGDLVCDTDNFCEPPPGCEDGQPCPAVCYGRCAEAPTGCNADVDCAGDEVCRFSADGPRPTDDADARPAPDDEAPSTDPCDPSVDSCNGALPPEQDPPTEPEPVGGVCVPAGCNSQDLAFPACPPGTEPVLGFEGDPCGEVSCRPVDDCRDLGADQCDSVPGCHTEAIGVPCVCAPGEDCACPAIAEIVCVPDGVIGCEAHSPDECALDPDCEGFFFGSGGECIDDCEPNGDCFTTCIEPAPTDEEDFICLPRDMPPPPDGDCVWDLDCADGQRCEVSDLCGGRCEDTPTGTVCTDECLIIGFCVDDPEGSCAERPLEECLFDDRCELVMEGCTGGTTDANGFCAPTERCVPRQAAECFDTLDCGEGELCELESFCPECNDGTDLGCLAPCWLEGHCVRAPPPPPPPSCTTDGECGTGFGCEQVEVCEDVCGGGTTDPDSGAPAPCPVECTTQGQCVWNDDNVTCFFDGECGDEETCVYFDGCFAPPDCPTCLIACMGICEATEPTPTLCMETALRGRARLPGRLLRRLRRRAHRHDARGRVSRAGRLRRDPALRDRDRQLLLSGRTDVRPLLLAVRRRRQQHAVGRFGARAPTNGVRAAEEIVLLRSCGVEAAGADNDVPGAHQHPKRMAADARSTRGLRAVYVRWPASCFFRGTPPTEHRHADSDCPSPLPHALRRRHGLSGSKPRVRGHRARRGDSGVH